MNLRQPYEQLIADKLRHLPAPDATDSWQQMKRLLDDDEDTRGGARKRPPGGGWWRIGILAVVLSAGFWIYQETATSENRITKTAASAQPNSNRTATANANNKQKTAIDNTTTLPASENNNKAVANKVTGNATSNDDEAGAPKTAANNPVGISETRIGAEKNNNKQPGSIVTDNANQPTANTPGKVPQVNALYPAATGNGAGKNKTGNSDHLVKSASNDHLIDAGADPSSSIPDHLKYSKTTTGRYTSKINASSVNGKEKNTNAPGNDDAANNSNNTTGNNAGNLNNYTPANPSSLSGNEKNWLERLNGLQLFNPPPFYNTSLVTNDGMVEQRDVSNILNIETKKAVAKAQRDKEIARLDKQDKKFHLNLSNVFKPFSMRPADEPWWAAGLAINGAVTVGPQNRFNYNLNGKSNTLSDYIPSPYLQYHLNDYVYFQTELNFVSPQYTKQLLVYRGTSDATVQGSGTAPISQQKSIAIQKMYYFNWPVSLHYSPVKNLFFSGGIQFSSFQSGLATIEERKYETALGPDHSTSISSQILKFKDDSIAAKIAPNEWRWQVGAEYYVNRFSVGLRYNQSLKKSVNTIAAPGLDATVNRNESLLFFIRYNLFESKNKK